MYDLNDAEQQRSGIMDPCFAKVIGVLRPGGIDGPALNDRGLLRASKSSDVLMLDWEFTVIAGINIRRKFWQAMTVCGGDVDEKGQSKGWNITKSQLRAIIDSALGLNPKDESESARQRRVLHCLSDLNGITFAVKIGIKKDKDGKYQDQNFITHIVTPDEKEWQPIMNDQDVPIANAGAVRAQGTPPAWAGAGGGVMPPQTAWGGAPTKKPVASQPPAWQTPSQPQAPGWSPTATAPGASAMPAQAAWGSAPASAGQTSSWTGSPAATEPAAGPAWLNG